MRGKLAFIVGASVGYVLGSRAGRERYEQIRRVAKKLWNTNTVQKGADSVKQAARRAGSEVLNKLAEQTAGKPKRDAGNAKQSGGSGSKASSTSSKTKASGSRAKATDTKDAQ